MEKTDIQCSVKELFNLDNNMMVSAFSTATEHVPAVDPNYCFNKEVTLSILAGFMHNRRVLIQGYHGTGKSTHIEQVAARLKWPCFRINLDGHINRMDLLGRDTIIVEDGLQVTRFKDGIIPWAIKRPMALVFDEYDSARPDVMFVLQRVLEAEGKLSLLDTNEVITPHAYFRMFATTNTLGLGDNSGLYYGVQPINQGQMDRWNIVVSLNYLSENEEQAILAAKVPFSKEDQPLIKAMVACAHLTREGFKAGDISSVMSPRTVITWAENYLIFKDVDLAFKLTFMNKCDESEHAILAEYYQRCFARELLPPKN